MASVEGAFRRGKMTYGRAVAWLLSRLRPVSQLDLKQMNLRFVQSIDSQLPHDEAMERAVGGGFGEFGAIEAALLRHYGLAKDGYLIDVGCGSGRLAKPLSGWLDGRYLGIDLVPALLAHARKVADRPDWRFEVVDHIGIPEADGCADMVCFFSVLTHLLHEQSFWYLEEARRVLKPGGRVVFSFLEFRGGHHMPVFRQTVGAAKRRIEQPLNVFIDRDAIAAWAGDLGLEIEAICDGPAQVVTEGALGQSHAVLRKPH